MSTSEKFNLKWDDFKENITTAFGSLREEKDFADVTLACEDGHQLEAHKVILAASSPFFQNILKRNQHKHPLIYMRGMKSEDLVSVVDFPMNLLHPLLQWREENNCYYLRLIYSGVFSVRCQMQGCMNILMVFLT